MAAGAAGGAEADAAAEVAGRAVAGGGLGRKTPPLSLPPHLSPMGMVPSLPSSRPLGMLPMVVEEEWATPGGVPLGHQGQREPQLLPLLVLFLLGRRRAEQQW